MGVRKQQVFQTFPRHGGSEPDIEFFISFQFAGLVIGLVAGVLAERRRWDAVPSVLGGLALFVALILLPDLLQGHGASAVMGAVALGPIIGVVPVGLGFLAGRWASMRLRRSGPSIRK